MGENLDDTMKNGSGNGGNSRTGADPGNGEGCLTENNLKRRIRELEERGVVIPDPGQVYIAPDVDPARIRPESVLWPGTRLTGKRTFVGSRAQIGTEGPAVISDTVIGPDAEVASGFLSGSTLLPHAKAGANSHYRAGTLLEEHASTAHCVGLKQSILMYGVTCGSLINFCDILITGGRSRKEHTEVGSGFIHFNYTPWGDSGDKATPSLIGNVTEGVFLDQPRIFLGGMSGMVGPQSVGFGAMTIAGQVVRKPVAEETMHGETGVRMSRGWSAAEARPSEGHCRRVTEMNIEFLTQLYALGQWYLQVRLKRSRLKGDEELTAVLEGAVETVCDCVAERLKRYNSFAKEWGLSPLPGNAADVADDGPGSVPDWKPELDHDQWIRGLSEAEKAGLHDWIAGYAEKVRRGLAG